MYLHSLNSSKILMGIAMLILNVGSKYVQLEFSKTQESALKSALTREILIFVIIFTATHDIIISILMTAAFVILANHLFNDQSKFCIIPQKYWACMMQQIQIKMALYRLRKKQRLLIY